MSFKMLRHKTHERFSWSGINIFCQYEINPGINSQRMLQHGSNGRGKSSDLQKHWRRSCVPKLESKHWKGQKVPFSAIYCVLSGKHISSLWLSMLTSLGWGIWSVASAIPALANGGVMKAAGAWSDQHNGSVLGTIKHWIDHICFLAQTRQLVDKAKSSEIFDTSGVYCLRKSHGSHSSDKVGSVLF